MRLFLGIIFLCLILLVFLIAKETDQRYTPTKTLRDFQITILSDKVLVSNEESYHAFNPSLYKNGDKVIMLSRISNALCPLNKKLKRQEKENIELEDKIGFGHRSYIRIDHIDLFTKKTEKIRTIQPYSTLCGPYGLEDPRGFFWNGQNMALCVELKLTDSGCRPNVVLYNIDKNTILHLKHPVTSHIAQKNWLPLVIDDDLYIVADYSPHRILKPNLLTGECTVFAETPSDLVASRGSAGFIKVENMYIGIVHYHYQGDHYSHRFYAFSDTYPFEVVAYSDIFCVDSGEGCMFSVQMLTGILLQGDTVYISGSDYDRNCFLLAIPLKKVLEMLSGINGHSRFSDSI